MADPFSATPPDVRIPGVGTVPIPFNLDRFHRALDTARLDAVLVTSAFNIRYLTGGYRCLFFDTMEPIGLAKYAPALLYRATDPSQTFFIGSYFDKEQFPGDPIWVPNVDVSSWATYTTTPLIVDWVRKQKLERGTIGIEFPFLPADMYIDLQRALPDVRWADAVKPLELLRAVKRPDELEKLRRASERVVDAMLCGFRETRAGMTSREIEQIVAVAERRLGLAFDYCLVGLGKDTNRTPRTSLRFERDMIMDFDSGGNIDGYIGDLCRMASDGEPEPLQQAILQEIDHVQMAARVPIRAGARGGEVVEAAQRAIDECAHGSWMGFIAHGMGLVSHEAPRLMTRPVPVPNEWAERPLEAGMVLSIETTVAKPECGYIKLEDTVAVTETGWDGYGDTARGWNPIG